MTLGDYLHDLEHVKLKKNSLLARAALAEAEIPILIEIIRDLLPVANSIDYYTQGGGEKFLGYAESRMRASAVRIGNRLRDGIYPEKYYEISDVFAIRRFRSIGRRKKDVKRFIGRFVSMYHAISYAIKRA